MNQFHINDIFLDSWDPLSDKKIYILLKYAQKRSDYLSRKLFEAAGQMAHLILELLVRPGKKKIFKSLTSEQKRDIMHDMEWIGKSFYRFPVSAFKLKNGMTLHPPEDKLAKSSFAQFKYADAEYTKAAVLMYHQRDDQAQQHIDALISALYLPENTDFSVSVMAAHSELISESLKPYQRALIYMTYGYIRGMIIDRCPNLFTKSEQEKESEPIYTGLMWQHLHFDLAETEAFQGFDNAGKANLYDVLDYLERRAIQYKSRRND